MLGTTYYFRTSEKLVAGFGDLFNDIYVQRFNPDYTAYKTVQVPISYAPRQKWLGRLKEDYAKGVLNIETTLPRLSYEIVDMVFDQERAKNQMNSYFGTDALKNIYRLLQPVPYNFTFQLNLWVKTLTDKFMVLEQILPYFQPEFTITIVDIPEVDLCNNVPIILEPSINDVDEYEGGFDEFRMLNTTLTFTAKGYLYPPLKDSGIIKKVNAYLRHIDPDYDLEKVTVAVNPLTANKDDVYTIDTTITPL